MRTIKFFFIIFPKIESLFETKKIERENGNRIVSGGGKGKGLCDSFSIMDQMNANRF